MKAKLNTNKSTQVDILVLKPFGIIEKKDFDALTILPSSYGVDKDDDDDHNYDDDDIDDHINEAKHRSKLRSIVPRFPNEEENGASIIISLSGSGSTILLLTFILVKIIKYEGVTTEAKRCQVSAILAKLLFSVSICGGTVFR